MSFELNKALARRFGQVWGREGVDRVDELASAEIRVHYPAIGEPLHGPEAFKQVLRAWHSAFPDSDRTDEDEIAAGDQVVIGWTMRGTHQGDLWGIPPTGRSVTMKGISIYRIIGGKIVEERGLGDALTLMRQLGAVLSPVSGTSRSTSPGMGLPASTRRRDVPVAGTVLAVELRGSGRPLLLIHGGGEDAGMLAGQAESLAAAGFEVISYDRRGTGRSGRENWPGAGADQHADDAAALLEALAAGPAIVVGVSSGGVIALNLAVRHPHAVSRVVAWEPPAAGVVPQGDVITAEIMAPVHVHLTDHPGDFVGAQAILLSTILGFPVSVDDPDFAATRANAEPMVLDEPAITLQRFEPGTLSGADVAIGRGSAPLELIAAAALQFERWTGQPPVVLEAPHEVYLVDPAVLTGMVISGDGHEPRD